MGKCRFQFLKGGDLLPLRTKRPGKGGEIGLPVQRGAGVVFPEKHGLPLPDHAQNAVVADDDHKGQIVCDCRGKLLQTHAETAVAGKKHHPFAPLSDTCAYGGAQTVSHGPQAPRSQKSA